MKSAKLVIMAGVASAVMACAAAPAEGASAVELPSKDKFKIVVLAGQSNMAGRGKIDLNDNRPHPRVVMLNREGKWVPCVDPVHFDVNGSGVGPGKAFGEALADSDPSITVGLVPCAIGGSPISVWEPGKSFQKGKTVWHPYDDMVARVTKAKEQGTLAAILWHQGESDCMRRCGYLYQVKFPAFVERMRRDLGAEGVPLIVGGLHPKTCPGWFGNILARTHKDTCEKLYGPGLYVPAKNWPLEADNIHYTGAAQRDFAKLYFAAYKEVAARLAKEPDYWKKIESLPSVPDNCVVPADQMQSVPENLPERIEKYAFPKGRRR